MYHDDQICLEIVSATFFFPTSSINGPSFGPLGPAEIMILVKNSEESLSAELDFPLLYCILNFADLLFSVLFLIVILANCFSAALVESSTFKFSSWYFCFHKVGRVLFSKPNQFFYMWICFLYCTITNQF